MKRALEIAYTVCNKVCEWVGGWVYVCHSCYSIAHLVMSTKSVSFSMGYIFTWRIFPWRWTKMCIAHLHTFHMWIDRHRESLCSIYSIHSPKPITKTLSPPPIEMHQLPNWHLFANNNNVTLGAMCGAHSLQFKMYINTYYIVSSRLYSGSSRPHSQHSL